MSIKSIVPFGAWASPLHAALITQQAVTLSALKSDGTDALYWLESRPLDGGRVVPVAWNAATKSVDDLIPAVPTFNVRSRVHE